MNYKELTQEQLKTFFRYSAIDGSLIRKSSNKSVALDDSSSALRTNFTFNKQSITIPVNQLIWMLCFGSFSQKIIFNKDFNKYNIRLTNLLEVSRKEHSTLLLGYKNLTKYCTIKTHSNYPDTFIVNHLSEGKLLLVKFFDYASAKTYRDDLLMYYRRLIIQSGGIPPE